MKYDVEHLFICLDAFSHVSSLMTYTPVEKTNCTLVFPLLPCQESVDRIYVAQFLGSTVLHPSVCPISTALVGVASLLACAFYIFFFQEMMSSISFVRVL